MTEETLLHKITEYLLEISINYGNVNTTIYYNIIKYMKMNMKIVQSYVNGKDKTQNTYKTKYSNARELYKPYWSISL